MLGQDLSLAFIYSIIKNYISNILKSDQYQKETLEVEKYFGGRGQLDVLLLLFNVEMHLNLC